MTLLASLATGLGVFLLLGLLTGTVTVTRARPAHRRRRDRGREWLAEAGTTLSPARFWAACAGLGTVVFALMVAVTDTPAVAVVPAAAAGLLPRAWLARERTRRLRELQRAWPDGLREIVAGVASGMSLAHAVGGLAGNGPPPLRDAFGQFPTLVRALGVVPALEIVREQLSDPTSDRIIEVLVLAHERGGRIVSEVLRDLSDATVRDIRASEEVATSGLEQRINGRAVFVLPWAVLLLLTARPGDFRIFYQSPDGVLVVAVAAGLSLLGVWLLGRLGREPLEERVFGGESRPGPG
ncbi:MAG: type II secretion system F family protein [Actinobacteria bacterium]|nr:type II secretion system F family protein [Actinomycetota bacterium]